MIRYRGFSTVSSNSQKKFVLTNHDIIKQDLLNNLMTHRGQRVMNPNFGCLAWEKIFENLSTTDINDIAANISSIVNADPRVTLSSIDISQSQNSITITLVLTYTDTNESEQMILTFNSDLTLTS